MNSMAFLSILDSLHSFRNFSYIVIAQQLSFGINLKRNRPVV